MKVLSKQSFFQLIRFNKGEEIISSLQAYCEQKSIYAASFQALGAAKQLTLSYYNLSDKRYEDHDIDEEVEILSILGNVATMDKKIIIHAHGVFGKRDLQTIGGHIKKLVVSATCEVSLIPLSGTLIRAFDEETGLNLLDHEE
jgi:predicted DNA-binding protein with PD1-like motif